MVRYTMKSQEYIAGPLMRAKAKNASLPLEGATWDKKGETYVVNFPAPLNESQKRSLESEGVVFVFG